MNVNVSTTDFFAGLIYLAIGLAVYMWIGAFAVFTWASPWVYIYMLLWPFIVIWQFLFWVIIGIVAVACLIAIWVISFD